MRHRYKATVIIWLRTEKIQGGVYSDGTVNRLSSQSASGCAAHNKRKKDARLLYMMELASSRLPLHRGCCAIIQSGKLDDLFCAIRCTTFKNRTYRQI